MGGVINETFESERCSCWKTTGIYKMRKDTERKLQKVKKKVSKSAGTNEKLIQKGKRQNGERKPKRLIDNQRQI